MGDRYAECQPSQPEVDEGLIGRRLDVCCSYQLESGGAELRWCQGEVVLVSDGCNMPKPPPARSAKFKAGEAVMVLWDACKVRKEDASRSEQRLLPSMWNPKGVHRAGAWRFDLEPAP